MPLQKGTYFLECNSWITRRTCHNAYLYSNQSQHPTIFDSLKKTWFGWNTFTILLSPGTVTPSLGSCLVYYIECTAYRSVILHYGKHLWDNRQGTMLFSTEH